MNSRAEGGASEFRSGSHEAPGVGFRRGPDVPDKLSGYPDMKRFMPEERYLIFSGLDSVEVRALSIKKALFEEKVK